MGILEAVSAVKTSWDTLTKVFDASTNAKLNEVKVDMSKQLLELYLAAFALVEANATKDARVREIEAELVKLRQKADRRKEYEPFSPYTGTTVMRRKPADGAAQPGQDICPDCLEQHDLYIMLQFDGPGAPTGHCTKCGTHYRYRNDPPLRPPGMAMM